MRYKVMTNSSGHSQIMDKLLGKFLSINEACVDLNRHYQDKIEYREENRKLKGDLSHRIEILEKKVKELENE